MEIEGEWTEARRRKWKKKLSTNGDRLSWNHGGVTTMFVSNLPPEVNKKSLAKMFAKFGAVVDVYIATKKDAKKKCFAFVRFKKVGDEQRLENALQGVKYGGRILEVNIAMFERKPAGGQSERGIVRNQFHNHIPPGARSNGRMNQSYAAVVAGDHHYTRIPPPPPQLKTTPVRLSDDSPLRAWIKEFQFERIAWIKIVGLSPELWSEENVTAIDATYGNGKVMKIGISEVDIDWVPFKSHRDQLDENSISEDDGTDDEDVDDDDGISEIIIAENNNELEEGEIGTMDADRVGESNRDNRSNMADNDRSPAWATFLADNPIDRDDRRSERYRHGEHPKSDEEINAQLEVETLGSKDNINDTSHVDLEKNSYVADKINESIGPGGSSNGPLNKMVLSGCFGPFPNTMDCNDMLSCELDVNFDSTQDKRRRIERNETGTPMDSSDFTPSHPSLDLNRIPIPTLISLPEIEVYYPSSSAAEIRNTVVVVNILGFKIDVDNPVLKEALDEDGENQIMQ
ncbi:unnamed protein product [Lactuca virosa]|uniref:RRM domain-containing protein n=1 Tax=Lactuca virosa TaxID=75947 RepID=A0AAU9PDL0_9ASTR|nr:unnamed protein product [Lactuca virosa]